MIDKYKNLISKTNQIEESLNLLEANQENSQSYTTSFTKNLLNYSIIGSKKLLLANFDIDKNATLTLQCQIDLNLLSSQNIAFALYINNFCVFLTKKILNSGYNQISLIKNFTSQKSENISVYLEIKTLNNKVITLLTETLLVHGLNSNFDKVEYNAIELSQGFLISFLNNNNLYLKYSDKENLTLSLDDFTYHATAKSHCITYMQEANKVYLFRVDEDGRLFYSNLANDNEIFITHNVKNVYAAASQNKIFVCFIKDFSCYYFDIENNIVSNIFKLDFINSPLSACYAYFNNLNNKFYVIVTDKYNSNYIVESVDEHLTNGENIKAKYKIEISTYEVDDETLPSQ